MSMQQGPVFYAPPPPPPSNRGPLIFLIVGLSAVLLMLGCCAGGVYFAVRTGRQVVQTARDAYTTSPAAVRARAKDIADFQAPTGFSPAVSMKLKNPLSGENVTTMVVYTDNAGGGIVFYQLGAGLFDERQREQVQRQMEQQSAMQGAPVNLSVQSRQVVTYNVRGKPCEFVLIKGKDNASGKEMWQVCGAFEGKEGPAMLMIILDAQQYDEEDVRLIAESVK
ncbi:MAG: hypothetical protein HYS13_03825 [Planctomycetia bacterium]|nr:hypothetical protein [Planctomycetia bacterium]